MLFFSPMVLVYISQMQQRGYGPTCFVAQITFFMRKFVYILQGLFSLVNSRMHLYFIVRNY